MSGRKRGCMLDSYRDRVEELLDAGCTFADISDHMAEEEQIYVEPTTVAYFVRSRKLSSKVTQGCRNNRINSGCKSSPMSCPKRDIERDCEER